jgi:hypothetical protein
VVGKPIVATKESMRRLDNLRDRIHSYVCNTIDAFIDQMTSIYNNSTIQLN